MARSTKNQLLGIAQRFHICLRSPLSAKQNAGNVSEKSRNGCRKVPKNAEVRERPWILLSMSPQKRYRRLAHNPLNLLTGSAGGIVNNLAL